MPSFFTKKNFTDCRSILKFEKSVFFQRIIFKVAEVPSHSETPEEKPKNNILKTPEKKNSANPNPFLNVKGENAMAEINFKEREKIAQEVAAKKAELAHYRTSQ